MRIYVASSWRNERQPEVVKRLREAGHEVYDFRHPPTGGNGFNWREIDPDWENWTPKQLVKAYEHPAATHGLGSDLAGMEMADATVLVMPCGRSAHLGLGYALGAQKFAIVLLGEKQEPELMWALADLVTDDLEKIVSFLENKKIRRRTEERSIW